MIQGPGASCNHPWTEGRRSGCHRLVPKEGNGMGGESVKSYDSEKGHSQPRVEGKAGRINSITSLSPLYPAFCIIFHWSTQTKPFAQRIPLIETMKISPPDSLSHPPGIESDNKVLELVIESNLPNKKFLKSICIFALQVCL